MPTQRLVKRLYSTLGCVITFNPIPFKKKSLSLSFETEDEAAISHPGEKERQVEVVRRREFVLTFPPFLHEGHLLVYPSPAKRKTLKTKMLSVGQRRMHNLFSSCD